MKRTITSILCALMLFQITSFSAEEKKITEIYVSANGNDEASGSIDDPLLTLNGARLKIRQMRKDGNDASFNVLIRGGIYNLSEGIKFTNEDSAAAGQLITYSAYDDEDVVLVGGKGLKGTDFYKIDDEDILKRIQVKVQDKIVGYDLKKDGITREMIGEVYTPGPYTSYNKFFPAQNISAMLFYDGELMTVSRWPNSGFAKIKNIISRGGVGPGQSAKNASDTALMQGFTIGYDDVNIDKWVTAPDAMLYCQAYYDWASLTTALGEINPRKRTLSSKYAVHQGIRAYAEGQAGGQYYAFNLLEELDAPGEYYIDRENMILYFYPPEDVGEDSVIDISLMKDNMMSFENAKNIHIEKLNFKTARNGFVNMNNSENIRFSQCNFKGCTADAIKIVNGYECGVVNSEISNVNVGITVSADRNNNEYLKAQKHYILNNHIHDWGIVSPIYTMGISMSGTGCVVAKNTMHGATHQAIAAYSINCVYEYNEIYDTNREVDDSGVIYAQGNNAQRGNVFRYNYFHDIPSKGFVAGIYQDDTFSGSTIYGNLFVGLDTGIFLNAGHYHTVYNNIYIDCRRDIGAGNAQDSTYLTNQTSGVYYNAAKNVMFDNEIWRRVFPGLFECDYSTEYVRYGRNNHSYDNISVNSGEDSLTKWSTTYSVFEPAVKYSLGALKFSDPENGNYRIEDKTSVIYTDFKNFKYDFRNSYSDIPLQETEIQEFIDHSVTIPDDLLAYVKEEELKKAKSEVVVAAVNIPIYFKEGKYRVIDDESLCPPFLSDGTLMLSESFFENAFGIKSETAENGITVEKDGEKYQITDFIKKNDKLYLPARKTLGYFSYGILWDNNGTFVIVPQEFESEFTVSDYKNTF